MTNISISQSRVTIVCCYNDRQKFENELLQSIEHQLEQFEVMAIDNSSGAFSSCANAYNSVLDSVLTEYVVFSHQDILTMNSDVVSSFVDRMSVLKKGDLLGVAGVDMKRKQIVSSLRHGKGLSRVSEIPFDDMIECETIDECFFGGRTETFRDLRFNEMLCNNWHLYAVEVSLRTRIEGGRVYVCETSMVHTSTGTISHEYCMGLFRLCKEYKKFYNTIYTTCSTCKTSIIPRCLYLLKREIALLVNYS